MMRSLWSAVSGLNTHQLEMDVIGNNISNVNTTAYKSQATGFQDVLYQTIKAGSGAGQNTGAISASQVGLGARVASIYTNISAQGSMQTTGNALDLMITGPSFFVVSPSVGAGSVLMNYSRDGSFTIDANGDLVTQGNGYYVLGVMGDTEIPEGGTVTLSKLTVIDRKTAKNGYDASGNPTQIMYDTLAGSATTSAYMKGNLDSDDSSFKEGKTIMLEVYGTDGYTYTLRFQFDDAGDNDGSTFKLSLKSVTPQTVEEVNEEGELVQVPLSSNLSMEDIYLEYDKHNGRLKTITSGGTSYEYTYENGKMSGPTFNPTFDGDVPIGDLDLDLMNTTNYASSMSNHNSTIYAYKGNTKGLNLGYPEGELTGISFGVDGSIYGKYSNGQTIKKGQIAVAEFNNAMGLEKVGDNLYAESLNSGTAQIMDITRDGGYMNSGVLEASNVDLAKEFTDMITTQRGFQANSRVITTSDEMLQVLKGLKR